MSQEHLQAKWAVTSPSVHFQQTKSKPFIAIDISSRNRQEPRHSALEHNCNSTSSSSPRCWSLAPGRGGIQKWRLKSMKIECYQYRRIRACPHRHLERNTTPEIEKITPAAIQKGSKSPKSYHLEMILYAQNHIQSYPNLACCASSSPSDYLNPWPLSSKIWIFRVENNFHIPKSLLRNAGTPTMQIFNHRNFHIALPSNRRLPVRQHPFFFLFHYSDMYCCRSQENWAPNPTQLDLLDKGSQLGLEAWQQEQSSKSLILWPAVSPFLKCAKK